MAKTERCKVCHRLFKVTDPANPDTCSDSCKARLQAILKSQDDRIGTCLECGESFIKANKHNAFCSVKCRRRHAAELRKQRQAAKAASKPKSVRKVKCKNCGKVFEDHTLNHSGVFCSRSCRVTYHYQLKKQNATKRIDTNPPKVVFEDPAVKEMTKWEAARREREAWVKIPLEEAASLCKQYNLEYPMYQYMRAQGTLEEYIKNYEKNEVGR